MNRLHDRIEAIAGAIALGEATDEERRQYREHLTACPQCLQSLGGECEIERVASTVASARDSEVWEPNIGDVVARHQVRRSHALRWGLGAFGACIAVSFGVHVLTLNGVAPLAPAPAPASAGVVFEQRAAKPAAPARRLIVMHNVVQMARAPLAPAVAAAPLVSHGAGKAQEIVAMTVHPSAPVNVRASVPGWKRRDAEWRTIARTTSTSLTETAPQTLTHYAESIQITPRITQEAAPVGGETSINPQPPMIAYDENAEGTSAFEVLVDEHGTPTKCVITKSAGFAVLDETVCKAAMRVRYTPKMLDGRAVAGVYHDAFTFRMDDSDGVLRGVPKQ